MCIRNNTLRCFVDSNAGLSSSLPTVSTKETDPATWAFPLLRARGHTVISVNEMFELWVYICKYVSCTCDMYFIVSCNSVIE